MELIGEGEYNLNVLSEIKVTDSYLGLDQDVRKCQYDESFYNCTTRKYVNEVLYKCGCLPINMMLPDQVFFQEWSQIVICIFSNCLFQDISCLLEGNVNECLYNTKIDTSTCFKPCSGLIITSFSKYEQTKDLETLFPIHQDYDKYKKITPYPPGFVGK